jgi:hypothetical protein
LDRSLTFEKFDQQYKTIRAVRFTEGSLPQPTIEIPDYVSRPHLF